MLSPEKPGISTGDIGKLSYSQKYFWLGYDDCRSVNTVSGSSQFTHWQSAIRN